MDAESEPEVGKGEKLVLRGNQRRVYLRCDSTVENLPVLTSAPCLEEVVFPIRGRESVWVKSGMGAWYRKTGAIGRILPTFPSNRSLSVGKAETFDSKKSFSLTVPILPNYTRSPAGRTVPHGIAHILPHLVGLPACVSPLSHLFAAVTR